MTEACLVRQDFDSAAFGRPFYRMRRFDADRLPVELAALAARSDVLVDAKLPADRIEPSLFLQRLGFRKVSTQIALSRRVDGAEHGEDGARISARLALPPEEIARHAANFVYDRFALDIAIDRTAHDAFFARWIANSLSGARHRIADRPGGSSPSATRATRSASICSRCWTRARASAGACCAPCSPMVVGWAERGSTW